MNPIRPLLVVALIALLPACGKKDKAAPPAELTEFRATADVQRVWKASVGNNKPRLRLGLGLASAGQSVFAADHGGEVYAFDLANGKRQWRVDTRLKLSAGPGTGDGLVVVGGNMGDIVALDATNGDVKWKTRINSEILSAPYIGNGMVLVRATDGRMVALRGTDGTQAWSTEEEVPRLTLRGTSQPVIAGNLAVSGFDNGRVRAVQLSNGDAAWELTVAPPTGRSELERLVDIDTALQAQGNDVYVVTYQGKAASINTEVGETNWTRDVSSYSGLALDDDGFYVSSSDGAMIKIGRRTGVELWRQDVLARRRLSPPAVLGSLVAVADLKGYVHFLDKSTGALAARVHPLDTRVASPPVVSGDMLVMMDAEGNIVALRAAVREATASAN